MSYVGIDIGSDSVKVVQLRKERDRAVLETYGELSSGRYFEGAGLARGGGFYSRGDQNVVRLLTDVMRAANVTSRRVLFALPATSSFITLIHLPLMEIEEIRAAIPFEAKKYIPVPVAEVALDWQIIDQSQVEKRVTVLLAAVPHEVVAKYQRIAELMQLELQALEIESFSAVRSLLLTDRGVSTLIQLGALATTITIVEERRVRMNHNFGRGSREITAALSKSLGITEERAEVVKHEVGLSEKPEEREIADVIIPLIDSLLRDAHQMMVVYNRSAKRKIEKIILTGGGASLRGLVGHVSKYFGLETTIGNPFVRTIFPPFLAPLLKDIGPNFSVAVGLALREITPT